jgi:hypothetical protein
MITTIRCHPLNLAAALAAALATACSGTVEPVQGASQSSAQIDVHPPNADLAPGETLTFSATVTGIADTSVQWAVEETGGGSVDDQGGYVAPQVLGTYHLVARAGGEPSVFRRIPIRVLASPAVTVYVLPETATVPAGGTYTFKATVTGSTNQAVTWSVQETSGCGTISTRGVYRAPSSARTCTVVARSSADTTKSDTALVTVTAACTPATCRANVDCGSVSDGCGGTLDCGNVCPGGQTCGGGGTAHVCGAGNCTPATCRANVDCGSVSDGCGGTLDCGNVCPGGQTCGGGGTAHVCGAAGTVARPSYNTGTGFFVVGNKLYDANGVEFRIRGVNKLHWDADWPGIPNTHANTIRWDFVWGNSNPPTVTSVNQMIADHIVPMLENGQATTTCSNDPSTLSAMVDGWVANASTFKPFERYLIVNIANEWGPSNSTVWRDSYITAVSRLRQAGYLGTIAVDSGGCGQDLDDLVKYGQAVFDSDPQKNVLFGLHIYGQWTYPGDPAYSDKMNNWGDVFDLAPGFDRLAATGLPVVIGEFGPGRNIGPSPTVITPGLLIQTADSHGFGWLAWAWDDPANGADDTWFAMSKNGAYNSSADLTTFGKEVVENPDYGLLVAARPATIF